MQDLFAQTSFGRIHCLTAGSGTPLVLLHSNGGSAYEYEHVIEPLAKTFRVIAWDMPGQGDSDPLPKHIGVRDYARAVIETMDALGIEKAGVLGDSIGGAICVALGANHMDRMKKVFIVECPYRSYDEWGSNWENTEANYAPVIQTMDKIQPRFRHVDEALLRRWNIDRAKAGTWSCLSVMWALREYGERDCGADLARVPANQVVMFGDKGPTIAKIDRFRTEMKSPSVYVIENCGHFPMIDDPEEFNRIVELEMAKG